MAVLKFETVVTSVFEVGMRPPMGPMMGPMGPMMRGPMMGQPRKPMK